MRSAVAALFCFALARADEYEGRAVMLLSKKISPTDGFSINKPINVTITVYNKGPGNAYSIMVTDDNWKSDKFRIHSGGNNFTLDFLNAGDSYEHEFTVKPVRKLWHRVRPAKMLFVDGVEGDKTITHLSNSLPQMRVVAKKDALEENLLTLGRFVTFNVIKTKSGWIYAGGFVIFLCGVQLYFIGKAVLHKRRHLRALEDVKKL